MPGDRDVAAFARRVQDYDNGWLGRLHHHVAEIVASVAGSALLQPRRILDVGCGTGYLLNLLAERNSGARSLVGVDASPVMAQTARGKATDPRIQVVAGTAEHLPFNRAEFDLVISTTSFDHWQDQQAGLEECARVLQPTGIVVVADLFSVLLRPTLVGTRRTKARTRARAERCITGAGLHFDSWHPVQPLLQAFVARPDPQTRS